MEEKTIKKTSRKRAASAVAATRPNDSESVENSSPQQNLTRTHKAFGLFPNALLLFGYGESRIEKERVITTEEKNIATGEVITRQMKIYTNSEKGLPRGRDPQVLIALLHLTLQKSSSSNSVWFRKEEIMRALGWVDNQDNRQDIDEAIRRYFEAAYSGLDVKIGTKGSKKKEKFSRIVTRFTNIDERRIRHNKTDERLFSKVVFDEEFINEIRTADLSLHLNLNIVQRLQHSSIALRLYEVINYLTAPDDLKFEMEIKEFAHNRVGISQSKKTPGQIMQKLQPAADKLLEIGYLKNFQYDSKTRLVSGEVNSLMASPLTTGLSSLPSPDEKRLRIIAEFVTLGAYPNPVQKIINSLPEDQLDDAEIIADIIKSEKKEKVFGANFQYGGRALNQLKELYETGEINQSLLERSQFEKFLPADDDETSSSAAQPESRHFDAVTDDGESAAAAAANAESASSLMQMALPIGILDISVIDQQAEELWRKCHTRLKGKISDNALKTWFKDTCITPIGLEDNLLIIQAHNQTTLDWIQSTYADALQQSLNEATQSKNQWKIKWTL